MIDSLAQLSKILVGTPFEGSTKVELEISETQARAFAVKVSPEMGLSRLDAWKFFRSVLEKTQRWPVIASYGFSDSDNWGNLVVQNDFFSRREFRYSSNIKDAKELAPEAIVARAKLLDINRAIKELNEGEENYCSPAQILDYELSYTKHRFGIEPSKEIIPSFFQNFPFDFSLGLQKWLLDWEAANLDTEVGLSTPDLWYLGLDEDERISNYAETLILLPTSNSWETLAYLHYFGASSSSNEFMIALLQSWYERFGAELVSHVGLGMVFSVQRRPSNIDEAFQLAIEQTSRADFHNLTGIPLRDHARALLHTDRWSIWTKP